MTIAGRCDEVHRHQPPGEAVDRHGLLESDAEQAGDDCVDSNRGGHIPVLRANQFSSD